MVESHPAALRHLNAIRDKLGAAQVTVRRGDALALLASLAGTFDLIFLDPPYGLDLLPRLLPACRRLLAPAGLVYAESDQPFAGSEAEWLAGWKVVRADKAGQVHYALLSCDDRPAN